MKTTPMQDVIEAIDDATDPKKMSKDEYVEFLDELISDLEMRKDAAEREIEDDE